MNTVILLAAGKSQRAGLNKLWLNVVGRPLWTLPYETFKNHPEIGEIILVVPEGEEEKFAKYADCRIVPGGQSRMESFKAGLRHAQEATIIIDHNAASPFVTEEEISQVIAAAKKYGAAAVSHQAVDTIITTEENIYKKNLPREEIRLMQTPQAACIEILSELDLSNTTDLASALIDHVPVQVVQASPHNKKITFAHDLPTRTFIGEDSHRFSNEGQLTLGGLTVPSLPAMEANSDGDVILHAIGRALAQAQNKSFSQIADELCQQGEQNSVAYIKPLLERTQVKNLSLQIEGKGPRIDELPLKESLSKILRLPQDHIQIEAHTGEELTPFGRGEGIRCTALVTI